MIALSMTIVCPLLLSQGPCNKSARAGLWGRRVDYLAG